MQLAASGVELIIRSEESYRVCESVWSRNINNEAD